MMKEFSTRVNKTEKKCGPGKTRMTRHGWDTSTHIGATIASQEGWEGLDIYGCCALPIQGEYHEYTTTNLPMMLTSHAHNSSAHNL